ncbi:vacuolar protein sorting-associated protein 52 A-like isoform X4 [Panicum virgatum]|uniref:vacuolar protein sorting-associated protein 52 A-like isoform X4 n=1 Tax=Panicum virgatum TaxID=38727 RepID=UPI0019D66455|nr:vacuolar protein sorting-associated protein 52 A-like isoform X4 [Panicum virgatum]XP_039826181.1 vacuolar protein sorting-associated protein 52 A-like isoform X4 [Panicum virgatum]
MIYKKSTAGCWLASQTESIQTSLLSRMPSDACTVQLFFSPARLQSKQEQPPGRSKPKNRTDPAAPRSVQNARPLQSGASARIGSRPPLTPFPSPPDREKSRRGAAARAKARRTTSVVAATPMAWAQEQRIEERFGRFLCFDEDSESEDISLDELEEELEEHKDYDVLITILRNGEKQRGMATLVEGNLGHIEETLIQDYIEDNDKLALLHDQIHECDIILSQIGSLLSGFQAHIGSISWEIRSLQVKSLDISAQLKNRKLVETKLAAFVEEIIAPPGLVDILVNGEVNDGYARSLEILSKKLKFVQVNPLINASKALNDITQELERLRQKALSKVSSHIIEIFFAMRKPGTNIQILQQNLLQKHRYLVVFLKEHGSETYGDLCASYVDTMNKVLSTYFRVYVEALERQKLDIGASIDFSGHDTITDIIARGREHLRDHRFMFSLGERANILKEIDQPGLVPQVNSRKYPYEVIYRSIQKLLMDTASSEYLFVEAFFGDESLLYQVFEGPFAVIDHHLDLTLTKCHDAVCLMLMICITRKHQLVMSNRQLPCLENYFDKAVMYLWPRFKVVFDMYLRSSYQCDAKTFWIDGTHPHHIVRCYVEFTASLVQLNAECGDGQLDMNLERLRSAIDGLLVRLAQNFTTPKLQHLFVLNNYDMAISVLKEAGDEAKNLQRYFEDKLESNMMAFVVNQCSHVFSIWLCTIIEPWMICSWNISAIYFDL